MNRRARVNKIAVGAILFVLGAALLAGCIPKEIRTIKIELGTRSKPRSNPDIARVKENLTRAAGQYPDNPEVFYLWGRVYAMENNYVEMDKAFKKSEGLGSQFKADIDTIRMTAWDELVKQAVADYGKEDYAAALNKMEQAIICWPFRYDPYMFGADAAYRLGDNEKAYELSKKAYEMEPDSLQVIEVFANMASLNGKYEEAEAALLKLREKDPTSAQVPFQLSKIYTMRDDTSRAIQAIEEAVAIDKDFADGWFDLGLLYFQTRDFCKAADGFEHSAALRTPDADQQLLFLIALYECGDLDKARVGLEKFTMDHPENCEGWQCLANTYVRLKMKKEATDATKKFEDCQGPK